MLSASVAEALDNPGNLIANYGTKRVEEVLTQLGNPQHKYKVIHISGTNGKGSTAAFIETALCNAGYLVGKFSSPYIKTINECICLKQKTISDNDIEKNFWQIQGLLEKSDIVLAPFELLTIIMFNYFANESIDYLVLEVGMGGLDDATNVVNPLVSIITNISLEHTQFLGNSLAAIAMAKAGIVKGGLTIIADSTQELIDAVANKTQNYINILENYNFTATLDYDKFQTIVEINNSDETRKVYTLNLFGKFQAYNFLCAYHALRYLNITHASINYAAANTRNAGRFEVIERDPLLIFDATHNLAGAKNLVATLAGKFKPNDVVIISSILSDKDIDGMLKAFSTIAGHIICTTIAANSRVTSSQNLMHKANQYFKNVQALDDPLLALAIARDMHKKLILITGSLYLLRHYY